MSFKKLMLILKYIARNIGPCLKKGYKIYTSLIFNISSTKFQNLVVETSSNLWSNLWFRFWMACCVYGRHIVLLPFYYTGMELFFHIVSVIDLVVILLNSICVYEDSNVLIDASVNMPQQDDPKSQDINPLPLETKPLVKRETEEFSKTAFSQAEGVISSEQKLKVGKDFYNVNGKIISESEPKKDPLVSEEVLGVIASVLTITIYIILLIYSDDT